MENYSEEMRSNDVLRLCEANKNLKPMNIKDSNYIPVNERIKAFRTIYPKGSIVTEIISLENGVVTMKSSVYSDDGVLLGTGHAQEKEGSTFINKTSFIENCETSCIGRALGSCGIGLDFGFASYEEVANAKAQQNDGYINDEQFQNLKDWHSKDEIKAMYKELGITRASQIPIEYYEKKKAEHEAKISKMLEEAKADPEKPFY